MKTLDTSSWEAEKFSKREAVLNYIALKGCAWSADVRRNLLFSQEDINQILAELVHEKTIQIVRPFERFSPPDIVMTRLRDLQVEAANSLTPENWNKRSFFFFTEDGFHKWVARHSGEHKRAHNIYLNLFSLTLEPENGQ